MRTAARIALVLTGTAIFVAAMAMPVAHADGLVAGKNVRTIAHDMTADLPRPQPAPRPEKLPGYAHAELLAALSNIARFLQLPELPVRAGKRKDRSISPVADTDALDRERIRHSEGGRGDRALGGDAENDDRTRQVADSEQRHLRAPAPVIVRFEGVININVAGLGW